MPIDLPWPDFSALASPLAQLAALSRYYGANPDFVLAGGGNTSVKIGDRLEVKASGYPLSVIQEEGFVALDRPALDALLEAAFSDDVDTREEQFKQAIMAARIEPGKGQRPSVECVLHHLMPGQFVVHTHATQVNMLTCNTGGQARAAECFGDTLLWLPYVTPGYILSKELQTALAAYRQATGKNAPEAVFMENHGLIVSGDTPEEIRDRTNSILAVIQKKIDESAPAPFGAVTLLDDPARKALVMRIAPALRGLLADEIGPKLVRYCDAPLSLALAGGADGKATALGGPLIPDQIVYCKSFPCWIAVDPNADDATLLAALKSAVLQYEDTCGYLPMVIVVEQVGIFLAGDAAKGAETIREVYYDALRIMAGARQLGGIQYMTKADRDFIESWEVERYRRLIAAGSGGQQRLQRKVALITGAAQGFGLGIAERVVRQGAHVVIADVNANGAAKAASGICAVSGSGMAVGVGVDVRDGAAVHEAVYRAVRQFGGLDLVIPNAGVLRAGSVKSLPETDFELVTDINYKGYFNCVQQTAPVMAMQHKACPHGWTDIIQINSKSGLEGSNRNGAYAGSKFGGIGLTQSFALELVEDHIKVNAICPGNFLDGPLWSDPDNGLFVQYLRSGKVPGAKTVEDVRKAYEAKVPMGRGCTPDDIIKAILYLVDQEYETGQALPVTGGQIMLS
ncbi:MAG: SDR family NAD(P)-dependent oxidoreductase [Candidatus Hydrogenedentes bacterium]|nr:SDR family NAD(P)-dependent oxidoreductase [Candidatus Hydrogenedentota bacterium]